MFAAGAEIPYVMAQVGHGDSKVTLEIYAQVLKRRDREQIGRAFDHLLVGGGRPSRAPGRGLPGARPSGPRRQRDGAAIPAESGQPEPRSGQTGPKPQNHGDTHPARAPLKRRNPHACGGSSRWSWGTRTPDLLGAIQGACRSNSGYLQGIHCLDVWFARPKFVRTLRHFGGVLARRGLRVATNRC